MMNTNIWQYPPFTLLEVEEEIYLKADRGDVRAIAGAIEQKLNSLDIVAKVVEVNLGPSITQYCLEIGLKVRISQIISLENDLALVAESPTGQIRIEAPIPGRNLVGIEIPNKTFEVVSLRTMLSSDIMRKAKSKLTMPMGLDMNGNLVTANIGKMPHALITGTTGSGKSVMLNSFISSLLFRASPEEVKLILIDPKGIEFMEYKGIDHLLTPVVEKVEKVIPALKLAVDEMDRRYKLFAEKGFRSIDDYIESFESLGLPYIVIFIDELADIASIEVEYSLAKLTQRGRAAGIHLIMATQKPSKDVIPKEIESNIPARIGFYLPNGQEFANTQNIPGEYQVLDKGSIHFLAPQQPDSMRIQCAYISDKEIRNLVKYIKTESKVQ